MNMNRRQFTATCAAGAAALTLGAIPKAKAREVPRGLEAGDEVMFPHRAEYGIGVVDWVEDHNLPMITCTFPQSDSPFNSHLFYQHQLVRVLPGPLKEGDRVASLNDVDRERFLGTVLPGKGKGFHYDHHRVQYDDDYTVMIVAEDNLNITTFKIEESNKP